MTVFKSAETVHLILLCYLCDAVRCDVLADLKMVARNRLLALNDAVNFAVNFSVNFAICSASLLYTIV